MIHKMQVVKRDGSRADVDFTKIMARLAKLRDRAPVLENVDIQTIVQRTIAGLQDGMSTSALDTLAAETAVSMTTLHIEYGTLAARIFVSDLHKNTAAPFADAVAVLGGKGVLSDETVALAREHAAALEEILDPERDYLFDFFGLKTLERSYLLRASGDGPVVERPCHMYLRVALGIHGGDIASVRRTYDLMTTRKFTHASPTLFNAGTRRPQMSSCFLTNVHDDSIGGIYDSVKDCAMISKSAGGIGMSISNVRARGSQIRSSNGTSSGIVPMLRVVNETARYVDQGSRRKGAIAAYLEPWHADVRDFLPLRKNHGPDDKRCRDTFLALWIPDLFMRRVEADAHWTLMCPDEAPGLADVYGAAFDELYESYEAAGVGRRMRAQELWTEIINAQIETGTPYVLFKDAANAKSNQRNLGTIKCSNLCTEIIEYSNAPDETAVCNLASIALPAFVVETAGGGFEYDFDELARVTRVATFNLNCVIDRTFYPLGSARRSNMRHRPIGLGVQGLADVFAMMKLPFDGPAARELNRHIFETLYFAALTESCALAEAEGPYETYAGSPVSRGVLQQDMWPGEHEQKVPAADWAALRARIAAHGVRNSLLVAPMPTASTSQIFGFNECFEPFTSNMYVRRTLSGEFTVVNRHLITELARRGLWSEGVRDLIVAQNGSVQGIGLPAEIEDVYRTVWEIKQKSLVQMAIDRAPFVDQSQSLNIFMTGATSAKLTSSLFFAWRGGLKTGMYYLRTRPAADAIKFTLDMDKVKRARSDLATQIASSAASSASASASASAAGVTCTDDVCVMCSG